jgi:hypothetical protein
LSTVHEHRHVGAEGVVLVDNVSPQLGVLGEYGPECFGDCGTGDLARGAQDVALQVDGEPDKGHRLSV